MKLTGPQIAERIDGYEVIAGTSNQAGYSYIPRNTIHGFNYGKGGGSMMEITSRNSKAAEMFTEVDAGIDAGDPDITKNPRNLKEKWSYGCIAKALLFLRQGYCCCAITKAFSRAKCTHSAHFTAGRGR